MGANSKDSLIKQAKRQMELMPSSAMPDAIFAQSEEGNEWEPGDFTGERLFERRPDAYRWIVSLAAERTGMLKIAKLVKVSVNTVRAVLEREGVSVDTQKKEIARVCYQGAALAVDAAVDDLADPARRAKIPFRDKVMGAAILVDKAQLLSGEATARLEVTEIREPDHNDFNAYVQGLRSAKPEMGLDGEKAAQKGTGADLGVVRSGSVPGVVDVGTVEEASEGKRTEVTGGQP